MSGRFGFTLEDFFQGEQVVEALLLASGSVTVWMSIQSRGFVRLQVLNHVSLSFAVDVISTSRSCDTASKKRETNTSCREQELSIRHEALHLREANAVLREHELVTQKGHPLWKFQDEVVCLQTLRSHLVFEMDAVMKELSDELIARFLVNVIAVHTDVAQDNCHATTVSRRNPGRKLSFAATPSH